MTRPARGFGFLLILVVVGGGLGVGGVWLVDWLQTSRAQHPLPAEGPTGTGPSTEGQTPATSDALADFPAFWRRAIEAHGGRDHLASIKSLRTHVQARSEGGPEHSATLSYRFPDCHRMDMQPMNAELVHSTDGEVAWSSFDQMRVPEDEKDRKLLEEQLVLARLSLLVSFDPKTEIDIEVGRIRDGLQRVTVRFLDGDFGPYDLGFDPKSALLKDARWDTRILLHGVRKGTVRMEMSDYREVEGIRVPFEASYHIGDKARAQTKVSSVEINPSFAEDFFSPPAPKERVPVLERTLEKHPTVILTKHEGREPEFGRLDKALASAGLHRNGSRFRVVEDGEIVAVGYGIEAPEGKELPKLADGMRIVNLPACRAFTTAIAEDSEEAWAEAHRRLRERGKEREVPCETRFRHVIWGEKGPVQIQLLEQLEKKGKAGASEDGG